ncbi:MAG: chloride channel protein [Verrucomicrobiota bacterium]
MNRVPGLKEGTTFFRKWGLIGILVGVGSGLGALALIGCIELANRYILGGLVGYNPPLPGGEGGDPHYTFHMARPWLLPCLTTATGLLGGFLVWRFAPETAGIGTNAAIRAFHRNARIRVPTALFKLLTSALTIGGGLTSGREGPIAQIGAATGSSLADLLKLSARERNIALASGLGAGIAAIFKAPLAGAIIAAEIFYTEDFEVEALVPGLVASVVGYTIVGAVTGFQPVFTLPAGASQFQHPASLLLFVALGAGCGLMARFLIAFYAQSEQFFRRFPLWLSAGIGGLSVGLVGLVLPSVIGTGYGWAQFAIDQNTSLMAPSILLAAAVAEMLCASLTLSSGNSGGIFGPCVVTGGLLGGAFGWGVIRVFPWMNSQPGSFAVVGMMAFFAAAAKAPLSTIIMISEMTGGYGLLAPAMFAVVTAFVLSGRKTIFPAQVHTRLDSPFHADEFEPIVLRRVKVEDVMLRIPVCIRAEAAVQEAMGLMGDYGLASLPVVRDQRLCGRITLLAANSVPGADRAVKPVGEVMSPDFWVAHPNEDLFTILKRFASSDVGNLPVVQPEAPERMIGLITRSGLWTALEQERQRRGALAAAV